jgi:hypothetical protein
MGKLIAIFCWVYIGGYELARAFYVLILMPLAGGTFGSVVGMMIVAFALLIAATVIFRRNRLAGLLLLFLYLVMISAIWYHYEIPSWSAYFHDRFLDYLLLPAFGGTLLEGVNLRA